MSTPTHILEPLLAFDDKGPEVRAALARLEAALARYQAQRERGGILPNSIEALRVELVYHAIAIEGSSLTLSETQLVLEGVSPGAGKALREVYLARNLDRAISLIESWVAERSSSAWLHLKDLLALNARLTEGINQHPVHQFRSGGDLVNATLPAILKRASTSEVHPAVQAAELHYNIAAIHPFNDFNGPTARLLMNYHLLRRGYPHTIIEMERRKDYRAALEEANAGNPEPFALFIIDSIERSILRLIGND